MLLHFVKMERKGDILVLKGRFMIEYIRYTYDDIKVLQKMLELEAGNWKLEEILDPLQAD